MLSADTNQIFVYMVRVLVLFTALPVHECAHSWMANKLGDDTSAYQGRLTLNPFVHLDLVGSVLLVLFGFGWAKPVDVNPRRFRGNPRAGMALTAAAGPVSNVLMALLLTIATRVMEILYFVRPGGLLVFLHQVIWIMLTTNVYLAVFNLLPIPPLDGSKILGYFLPMDLQYKVLQYEWYIKGAVFFLLVTGILSRPLSWISGYIIRFLELLTSFIPSLFFMLY